MSFGEFDASPSEALSTEQRVARCELWLKLILAVQFPQLYGLL
jgi:hypothetical protein